MSETKKWFGVVFGDIRRCRLLVTAALSISLTMLVSLDSVADDEPGDEIDTVYGYRDRLRGEYRFYLKDQFNTVLGVADGEGEPMEFYSYGPYGDVAIFDADGTPRDYSRADVDNALFFQSRELDEESGLYYFRARYYKPSLGRFISVDPAQFDSLHNPYTFVENNPATMNDPMGDRAYSPSYDGCKQEYKMILFSRDYEATDWVRMAHDYTDRDPEVYENCRRNKRCRFEELFKMYFGVRNKDYLNRYQWDRVETFYRRMHRRFQDRTRTYKCRSEMNTDPGAYSCSIPGASWVRVYHPFWELLDFQQTENVVHEWAHSAGVICGLSSRCEVYGDTSDMQVLAENDPVKARKNADNYGWFAYVLSIHDTYEDWKQEYDDYNRQLRADFVRRWTDFLE